MQTHEEIQHCVSCESRNLAPIVSVLAGRDLYTRVSCCLECSLVFRTFRWTLKETERRYQSSSDQIAESGWATCTDEAQEQRRHQRYARNLSWLEAHTGRKPGAAVLDIACGPGTGLVPFQGAGYRVTGIDLHPSRVRYAKERFGIELVQGPFEHFDFGSAKFDAIVCSHFLEHAHHPSEILRKIHGLLSDSGALYLEVPNHFNFVTFSDALYMVHNNNFTPPALRRALQRAGFKVVSTHAPKTQPGETAPEHLGVVAVRDLDPVNVEPPGSGYRNFLVRSYFRSLGTRFPGHVRCSHASYQFSDSEILESRVLRSFVPAAVTLSPDGEVVAAGCH